MSATGNALLLIFGLEQMILAKLRKDQARFTKLEIEEARIELIGMIRKLYRDLPENIACEEAISHVNNKLVEDQEFCNTLFEKAKCYANWGRDLMGINDVISVQKLNYGLKILEFLMAAFPDNPEYCMQLGRIYNDMGKYDKAVNLMEICLKLGTEKIIGREIKLA